MRRAAARLAVLGCLCVAALPGASPAAIPGGARLVVTLFSASPVRGSVVDLDFRLPETFAPPALLTLYVPSGFGLRTDIPSGTAIGESSVQALTAASPSSAQLFTAKLRTGNPSDPALLSCAPGPILAVWTAAFRVAGKTLAIRFAAERTAPDEATLGVWKLVACLPYPRTAPAGARVAALDLLVLGPAGSRAFTGPAASGTSLWRLLVAPYATGGDDIDPDAEVEARSRVPYPHVLTAKATYRPKISTVVVTGRLTALGKPRPGVGVLLFVDEPSGGIVDFGEATTRADGSYAMRKRVVRQRRARTLDLVAQVGWTEGACAGPPLTPGGCSGETLAPPSPADASVRIPARKR